MQHQQLNASSESLPPPPAYLLDRNHQPHVMTNANSNSNSHYMTSSTSMGQMHSSTSAHNVTGNAKMLNDLRQSPGVMRRQLSLINNHHQSSNHSQNSHVIIFWVFFSAFSLSLQLSFPTYRKSSFFRLLSSFEFSITIQSSSAEENRFSLLSELFWRMRKENCFAEHVLTLSISHENFPEHHLQLATVDA